MDTKACTITEEEVKVLINAHAEQLTAHHSLDERLERLNYLNKRLKAFKEENVGDKELKIEPKPATGW